jgi:hypothetical protein
MLAAPSICICETPAVRLSRPSFPVSAAVGTFAPSHACVAASAASATTVCSRQSSLKTRAWRDITCQAHCAPSSVAASAAIASSTLSLGIDCGTSGARAILIDGKLAGHSLKLVPIVFGHKVSNTCTRAGDGKIVHESQIPFDKLRSEDWVGPWTRCAGLQGYTKTGSLFTHADAHVLLMTGRSWTC